MTKSRYQKVPAYTTRRVLSKVSSTPDPNIFVSASRDIGRCEVRFKINHQRHSPLNLLFHENKFFQSSVAFIIKKLANNQWLLCAHLNIYNRLFNTEPLVSFLDNIKKHDEFWIHPRTMELKSTEVKWNNLVLDSNKLQEFISLLRNHSAQSIDSANSFIPTEIFEAIEDFNKTASYSQLKIG